MTPMQFMNDEAVVELELFIGPKLAQFGTAMPAMPKFKVLRSISARFANALNISASIYCPQAGLKRLNAVHGFFEKGTKAKVINASHQLDIFI